MDATYTFNVMVPVGSRGAGTGAGPGKGGSQDATILDDPGFPKIVKKPSGGYDPQRPPGSNAATMAR